MIGSLMLDIAGTTLTVEDIELLQTPQVGGIILFSRNIESPQQVRVLTNQMRAIRPDILIAVDQEGGRVQRLKQGFTHLPAMGRLGEYYQHNAEQALKLAKQTGWLMATEVLAVGIDFSFAPVLDVDHISDVIGDRAFSKQPTEIISLANAFMQGMKQAGMATTGKHFPGHGSVKADTHHAPAVDNREYSEIYQKDMQSFIQLLPQLDAMMPAHVIYPKVDEYPAGFSSYWLKNIIRQQLKFDGVLFSDDLSMQAACVAGDADTRILSALNAGCDMGLVCNDRTSACLALSALSGYALPNQARLEKMRGRIADINIGSQFDLGSEWRMAQENINQFVEETLA